MPNRIIKDSICRSESYRSLSLFQRDFFIRLIVTVDDYGRYDARPKILKGQMYPLDSITDTMIDEALQAMSTVGLVDLYTVGGRPILQLTSWSKHQSIRAKKSKYPAKEESGNEDHRNSLEISGTKAVDSVDNMACIHLKSIACRCARNPIHNGLYQECNLCSLRARAHEIDRLYGELNPERELRWPDVLAIARQMLPFEIPLVRKAVLLTQTGNARDPAAYLFALAEDWNLRGIRTFEEFRTGKGASKE